MSKQAKVKNMHENGMDTKQIAEALGITRHDVNRCLSEMRRQRGKGRMGRKEYSLSTNVSERAGDYAAYNHRKSVLGARKALEAINAQ